MTDNYYAYPANQRTYYPSLTKESIMTDIWQCPVADCSYRGTDEQVTAHREEEGHVHVANVPKVDKWRAPGPVEEV